MIANPVAPEWIIYKGPLQNMRDILKSFKNCSSFDLETALGYVMVLHICSALDSRLWRNSVWHAVRAAPHDNL